MTSDIEKSFKAKLRAVAKEENRDPAHLWQSLVLERILVRLAKSRYRSHFVWKGGALLAKYVPIGRETKDLDFLALRISNDVENLRAIFTEIADVDFTDGFVFRDISIKELTHPRMAYAGIEVAMTGFFGKTRFLVAIDIGFSDIVTPVDKQISLTSYFKGSLFESHVSLLCYPQEFIFAEKLETVIYRSGDNSRMKDFHDIHTMMRMPDLLSVESAKVIIPAVFQHRMTRLVLPIVFEEKVIIQLQTSWHRYLVALQAQEEQNLPTHVSRIIEGLNEWLLGFEKQGV